MKFNTLIKEAEEMVIREGNYQIGKQTITIYKLMLQFSHPNSVLYLQ